MKAKLTVKKSKDKPQKTISVTARAEQPAAIPTASSISESKIDSGPPPPEILLLMAQEEPDQRELEEYLEVIGTLRDKSFSYREIAEWLCERGVNVDHNTVYRIYMKNLSNDEVSDELRQQEEEAIEDSERNR